MQKEVLGIDIGGVIMDRANDDADTSFFSDNYLATTVVPGTFETIARLVRERFGKNVFLISKCGSLVRLKTIHWLAHHRFFDRTGVDPQHVRFCRKRHHKAAICTELGVTHFIDDRLEVLSYLADVPERILFQSNPKEVSRFFQHLHMVRPVESWHEVLEVLLPNNS